MSTYARDTHRQLDRAYAESEARDGAAFPASAAHSAPDIARPTRWRKDVVSGPQEPKVLLLELSERISSKGRKYMAGWLGKASVVAFEAEEPDKFGNKMWRVFVSPQRQK
jgi:hypothetical protein